MSSSDGVYPTAVSVEWCARSAKHTFVQHLLFHTYVKYTI